MDEEHESCTLALTELLRDPTSANLVWVLQELEDHFQHEETLMRQHGFGGDPTSSFSALTSHVVDHERILDMARQELERLKTVKNETDCCGPRE